MEAKLTRFADVKPVYAFKGIARRTLAWGEQIMLIQNNFTPRSVVPEHAHSNEQLSYVVQGSLVVEMLGETYTLNTGDSLLIPSQTPHNATAPDGAVVIDIFSPPREDFK